MTAHFRFEKIQLHNYACFLGSHELIFNQQRTVILGGGGSGKTTISNALASLGPEAGRQRHPDSRTPEMTVEVCISGDRELARKYRDIIFLDDLSLLEFNQEDALVHAPDGQHRGMISNKARQIHDAFCENKPWKTEAFEGLDPYTWSRGSKISLGCAFLFAVRKVLNLDLPVVLDSPYAGLDLNYRAGLLRLLRGHKCQQILFLRGHEIEMHKGEVNYELVRGVNIPGTVVTKCS